jgi:hypothetical protein
MKQSNTVLSLTMDLLAHNAFNHLQDDEVSGLHHLILRFTEPLTPVQERLLLRFWNHACTTGLPPGLLHRCNTMLIQCGYQPMEMGEVEMELY